MMTDVEEMANPMQTNQRASTWDSQLDKMLDNHASRTTGVWFFRTPLRSIRWRWDKHHWKWVDLHQVGCRLWIKDINASRLSKDLKPLGMIFQVGMSPKCQFIVPWCCWYPNSNSNVSVLCWSPNYGRSNRWDCHNRRWMFFL